MALVSVVIPLYNKEKHIKRAIDSVLSQNVKDFELIVVDDGSTDRSSEVVKRFTDERIHLVYQKNEGVSAARNRGIVESTTDLIAFLDADDEWKPAFLNTILKLKIKYPYAGLYATSYEWSNSNNKIIPTHFGIEYSNDEGIIIDYFDIVSKRTLPFSSSSLVIPKQVICDIGMFQKNIWKGEDQDVWGKIALKYPIAYSPKIESIYHLDTQNRACRQKKKVSEIPFVEIAEKHIVEKKKNEHNINHLEEYVTNLKFEFALYNFLSHHYVESLIILKNCSPRYFVKNIIWYFKKILSKCMKS